MTLRIGVMGCGLIAGGPVRDGRPIMGTHAEACRAIEGASLVAAADTDATRLAGFGALWGVDRLYRTAEAMLDAEQLDIAIVATPPATHERLCLAALEFGTRGILCEKPFTGSARGARVVVEACRKSGTKLVVNFSRRWDESHQELARRLRIGALGAVRQVIGSYTGTMRGNGAHFVDTLLMLVPGDWRVQWTSRLDAADDGPVDAILTTSDGQCAFVSPIRDAEYFIFEIQLLGTRGRARLLFQGNDVRLDVPRPHPGFPGYWYLQEAETFAEMTMTSAPARALRALMQAVVSGEDPPVPPDAHVTSLGLIDAIVNSATRAENSR